MPFTFSHPAIVLPLRKLGMNYVSVSALIIGTMSPDFEYFLRMNMKSVYSHSFLGVFWFCLPISLLLWFGFHAFVKEILIPNLPRFFSERLQSLREFDMYKCIQKQFWVVVISIIVGAFSHIFWDSFTHETGFFVQKSTFLQNHISFQTTKIPMYKLAQHLSSLFGMLYISFCLYKLPIVNTQSKVSFRFWLIVVVVLLFFSGIRYYFIGNSMFYVGNLVVTAISCTLLSILLVCAWFSLNTRLKSKTF